MRKITFHWKRKSGFAPAARAHSARLDGKKYILPRGKKAREKLLTRLEKKARKPTFSARLKKQGLRRATSQPTQARYFLERKTLNVPGGRGATFDIQKFTYELNRSMKITAKTVKKRAKVLRRNAYKKLIATWEANKGRNFLFRIDTAYVNDKGEFDKVPLVVKTTGKDNLSDGRGYSMGRYLEIEKKARFIKYLDDTFYGFFKAFETYAARNGINFGQINALILEVS